MKMNASEPLMKRRKQYRRCQNLFLVLNRDKQQVNVITAVAASGVEMA
jgi:hypothetical protein